MSTAERAEATAGQSDIREMETGVREVRAWEARIDRSPGWAFAGLTALYAVVVACLSHVKLLWLDELITLHIAKLSSMGAIWNALARGADPNPPVTHLLVHWSRMVFGDREWVYRLPAMTGYWVGMLALFAYLRRRLPGTWAMAGTVLSMCMAAFDYSYESRSYGIFYGLAMLAFLCWCWAVEPALGGRRRWAALAGMVTALACGISTNYFAVLAFVPVAVGEGVRTWEATGNRQQGTERQGTGTKGLKSFAGAIEWRIWIAMAVAGTPLLIYRPLIAHAIKQFAPYAWNKVSIGQAFASYTEMVEIVLWPLLALFGLGIVAVVVERRARRLCPDCRERVVPRWMGTMLRGRVLQGLKPGTFEGATSARLKSCPYASSSCFAIPAHEAAGVFCFLAYPFIGYAVASIRGGMLSPRFVIPVCFGFAIAGAWTAYRLFGGFRRAGVLMLVFVGAWFLCRESCVAYWYAEQKESFYKVLDKLPEAEAMAPANAPIAIPDPLLALTFQHYAPPAQAEREVFPVDFPAVRAFRGDDSPEENLWAGRGWLYSVPIETVAVFQVSGDRGQVAERQGQRDKGTEGQRKQGSGSTEGEAEKGAYLILAGPRNWYLQDLRLHHFGVRRLPLETRAGAIGGFTPLAHGTPEFYAAHWGGEQAEAPVRFHAEDNVPGAQELDVPDAPGGKP